MKIPASRTAKNFSPESNATLSSFNMEMAQNPHIQQQPATNESLPEDTSGKGLLMKADTIAATYENELSSNLQNCSRPLKLVGILSTSSAPSRSYAEFTKKQCEKLGVTFDLRSVGAAADSNLGEGEGVEEAIIEANDDDSVDGIMVLSHTIKLRDYAKRFQYSRSIIPYSAHSRLAEALTTNKSLN